MCTRLTADDEFLWSFDLVQNVITAAMDA